VNLEVLRRKNVLLLISGPNISPDELSILENIYTESRQHLIRPDRDGLYEIVWIPIVDPTVEWSEGQPLLKSFEALQRTMPWYSVYHPKLIQKPVIDFIKEEWHFRNKLILVVLDPQGRVLSPNAIHMMWIWGSAAFPFTSLKEESLWRAETFKLDLLVDGIDPVILNWISEGRYIFLYGGDDIEWIRKFTSAARFVAKDSNIPVEMVYVGKSSHKEQVRKVTATITVEKISHCWQDPAMVWFFWTRLHSMLFSKIQLNKVDDHDDVMQGIKKLLSYDKAGGWAVLAKGSELVILGHGSTTLPTLLDYENTWKKEVVIKGFDRSIKDYHSMLHNIANPCSRFDFPVTAGTGRIPQSMKCAECDRMMVKHTTFTCCHDHEDVPETNINY
ncbi:protein SIEVE ELEMENT OCCLUSION B-like, partial [Carica papaya]|uniref:protein SIEVE ELEMENT OCCLUSION B-like n=1 Tax=Carica papaya TaxID=3649 RepID=UPI000B8CFF1F